MDKQCEDDERLIGLLHLGLGQTVLQAEHIPGLCQHLRVAVVRLLVTHCNGMGQVVSIEHYFFVACAKLWFQFH